MKKIKVVFIAVLVLTFLLSLAACTGAPEPTPAEVVG